MQWIFGPVKAVQCTLKKQTDLPTDMDDTYDTTAPIVHDQDFLIRLP